MLYALNHKNRLDRLANSLRSADTLSAELVAELVDGACARIRRLNKAGAHALQLDRLAKASAWTDLALAIVATELPGWTLRRVVYDGGAWHCSLSKNVGLPQELDDTADAAHENMALAILSAFVEARRRNVECADEARTVPQIRPAKGAALCCDNFV